MRTRRTRPPRRLRNSCARPVRGRRSGGDGVRRRPRPGARDRDPLVRHLGESWRLDVPWESAGRLPVGLEPARRGRSDAGLRPARSGGVTRHAETIQALGGQPATHGPAGRRRRLRLAAQPQGVVLHGARPRPEGVGVRRAPAAGALPGGHAGMALPQRQVPVHGAQPLRGLRRDLPKLPGKARCGPGFGDVAGTRPWKNGRPCTS